MEQFIREDIPSQRKELLDAIKDSLVIGIIRYSWWPPKEVMHRLNISANLIFRHTNGPFVLKLKSGLSIGFGSLPEKRSVTLWLEEANTPSQALKSSLVNDREVFAIDITDSIYGDAYLQKVIGQRVVSVVMLQPSAKNAKLSALPSEAGLMFVFENSISFILSHGLHNDSDDFAVISEQEIASEMREQIIAVEL